MKYHKIDSKLFVKNRKNFISRMKKNSIAFFNSNDIYPVSADSTLPFEQHRDIFYLSGVDQEESVLMLCYLFVANLFLLLPLKLDLLSSCLLLNYSLKR